MREPSEAHSSAPSDERAAATSTEDDRPSITVDRAGLFYVRPHSHEPLPDKEPETDMAKHIKALIQVPRLQEHF